MAGWFNIDYLRDPSFMKSAGGGSGYTAMGDVLSKFGGIINAERDRKYQLEQDRLKNERESKKVESEVNKNNSYGDYNDAIGWANHNETKTHHRNTEKIQRSKSSGGNGGKGSVFDIGNIDIFGGESPRQQVKKEFKEK